MADLASQFQSILGRPATQDELDYFNKHITDGNLQPYEVGQILQSTPEYQNTLLNKNTAQFGEQLSAQNKGILDQAGASAQSRFAGLGRPNTSALGASVMQAGGALAQQRQSALADFYGKGLNTNAALGAQQGQSQLGRAYDYAGEKRQRGYQLEDYSLQQNDFNNYQNAHRGWNAITPEFAIGTAAGIGGKVLGGWAGGGFK